PARFRDKNGKSRIRGPCSSSSPDEMGHTGARPGCRYMSRVETAREVTMALLGTLAEFQVDDILTLLSGTAKTGALAVEGANRTGRVWVDAGRIVGAELDDHHEPADVVFELLRLADGSFAFEAG